MGLDTKAPFSELPFLRQTQSDGNKLGPPTDDF